MHADCELPTELFDEAADALGDSPFTVISTHMLRQRLCRAYIVGQPARFRALVLHHKNDPSEPTSFGEDAHAIWQLLQRIEGWTCIETSQALAPTLGLLIGHEVGVVVRTLDDVFHTLTYPAPHIEYPAVRLLTPDDISLIQAAQPNTPREEILQTLYEGAMAGAIVDGVLVSTAKTYAISPRYCDIGVNTHEAFRKQGYSTVCTALVAHEVQRQGRIPVWSTSTENRASLRVAAKIGFREVGRMTYVIPALK